MKIAVLGGGNGCYAAAADLAEQGHAVRLWRRDSQALAPLIQSRRIALRDYRGLREVEIEGATSEIDAAVRGAELIIIPVPAPAQADIATRLAAHLREGQVIYLPPGTFGSYAMARAVRDAGNLAELAFAESGTLPYLTRKRGPTEIAITTRATRLPTGVFPARLTAHASSVIRAAYPAMEACEDALSGALMNAGPIIHPPLIVMNAGPLEHSDRFDIHNEGTQRAIRRVTDRLDAERIAIREALGYAAPHFPLADHYNTDRWMYGSAHDKLVKSGDWREPVDLLSHRYMREDVAYGLAFLASVAAWAKVEAPLTNGFLAIGGAVCAADFRAGPRTLNSLGLSHLTRAGMGALLREGFS